MQGSAISSNLSTTYSHESAPTHHGHEDLRMFGVVLFLVAESAIFLGLFSAYLIYRSVMPVWPPEGTPELDLLLP
ncbi:MAG: Cytochrome c oxidase polypeptide, partial [Cyanobacteriota bacterium]